VMRSAEYGCREWETNLRACLMAAALSLAATALAWGFDYGRYQAADLDNVIAELRPNAGVDIYPVVPLRMTVALTSYATACDTVLLKKAMIAAAIPRDQVEAGQITSCIKVRSAKGQVVPLFIQDKVAAFLPKEVPLGSQVTFFVVHVFTGTDGPGLLVNEFSTGSAVPGDRKSPA
jgi:hypothetical protein